MLENGELLNGGLEIEYNEKTGKWQKRKNPYCLIEVATKEDFEKLWSQLEWTPCSKRLPEDGETVIAQYEYIDHSEMPWEKVRGMGFLQYIHGEWVGTDGVLTGECVAWRLMPYEGEW